MNRTTFENLSKILQECFEIPIKYNKLYLFKTIAAKFYKRTYNRLLERIIDGNLIHADEISVKLQRDGGYVWIFTNMEETVFMYRPTRKADFLKSLLEGFEGVLVTDFFSGYDSLPCAQQKCIVHLIRDLNATLLKNPFDNEIKIFAEKFGTLMRSIVETIDRFGLKSWHMRKHKEEVHRFLAEFIQARFTCEDVEKLRKRVVKYKDKLFVFLDHDGIPWNNNNAEHAVKYFARYRRLVNGRITEQGLSDYLVLLSLYVTCSYKGIGFLDFLLSKERDIDKFADEH